MVLRTGRDADLVHDANLIRDADTARDANLAGAASCLAFFWVVHDVCQQASLLGFRV